MRRYNLLGERQRTVDYAPVRSGGNRSRPSSRPHSQKRAIIHKSDENDSPPPYDAAAASPQQQNQECPDTQRQDSRVFPGKRPGSAIAGRRIREALSQSKEQVAPNTRPRSAASVRMRPSIKLDVDAQLEKLQMYRKMNQDFEEKRIETQKRTPTQVRPSSVGPTDVHRLRNRPKNTVPNPAQGFTDEEIDESIRVAATFVGTSSYCSIAEKAHLCRLLNDPKGKSSTAFYAFGKVIGVGSFGKVRAGVHKLTTQRVAIKSYERSKVKDVSHWKRIEQEVRLMKRLNHPNIVRMFEAIHLTTRVHIVMERVTGKSMCTYVKEQKHLAENDACHIFEQITCAVAHMHSHNIVHRDIKLENIILDGLKTVKLVDFGFSVCTKDKLLRVFCGTPSYMAPEIVQRQDYEGKPVDVWSLGVLLYTMLFGRFPFNGRNYNELYRRIMRCKFTIPDSASPEARDLLQRILIRDPSHRFTINDVRTHPWFSAAAKQSCAPSTPVLSSHLISSNPINDIVQSAVETLEKHGVPKQLTLSTIMQGKHNGIASFYYLLLLRAETVRQEIKKTGSAPTNKGGRRRRKSRTESHDDTASPTPKGGIITTNNVAGLIDLMDGVRSSDTS